MEKTIEELTLGEKVALVAGEFSASSTLNSTTVIRFFFSNAHGF